jgi:hypothetical protein
LWQEHAGTTSCLGGLDCLSSNDVGFFNFSAVSQTTGLINMFAELYGP